jgi:toxin-antitoxin system PIN domain toxin
MTLIDANLLFYAYDQNSRHGEQARKWLESVLARLRLTTQPRMLQRPLTAEAACGGIGRLLEHPLVRLVTPAPRHWTILAQLIDESGARGPLIMGTDFAALAIEYDATVCTHDRDFARFPGLPVEYPI